MKALHPLFSLAALLMLTSCAFVGGSKQQDRINASLINGYQLTGVISRDGDGRELRKSTIEYNSDTNTSTWTAVDSSGDVRYRDIWFYDDNGRVSRVEARSASGDLVYTDDTLLNTVY